MKRISLLFLAALLILCGCNSQKPTMEVSPAHLTAEEEGIAKLLGADTNQKLFDFTVDDTMQSMQVNMYQLVGGQWELKAGGGGWNENATNGRIALGMEKIPEGLRVALQCGENYDITSYYGAPDETLPGGCATSFLSEPVEIVYEQEIPLAVQILTDQNQVVSYGVDYFFQPEEYEKFGYEAVYAITVRFSQQPVS